MSFNKSIHTLTLVWNEKRFAESKSARNAARRSIFRASTVLINSELKNLHCQNDEIRHEITRCHSDLQKYDDKLQTLDNMTQLATQSLEVYFQTRMENLHSFVSEQCRIISDGIQEEADHWKEIHAMLQQKLVVPGDLRSYGGGNGLPRAVRQSPNFSQIVEEEEQEEEEEKTNDVSTLLRSRTLTPLITQSLKKARLLASKLSQDTSMIIPPQLSIPEETIIEEPPPPPSSTIPEEHLTLHDVSAIEKEIEMDTDAPNPDLSVSLLPFIPTANLEAEQQNNKSIASTISDKTFVKTSLRPFSSDEEEEEEESDDDDTIMEESFIADTNENARPLLLTADRSIRQPPREEKRSLLNQSSISKRKVSFREPLNEEPSCSNNKTLEGEKSDYVRPTIVINNNTSKLPTIASADSNEEEEQTTSIQTPETKPIDEEIKICKSPVAPELPVPVVVENSTKRRTTRRTTTRLFRENQNDNLPLPPPVEMPTKTRYATRYSTRLAATVINEEMTTLTFNRRATRFTSE